MRLASYKIVRERLALTKSQPLRLALTRLASLKSVQRKSILASGVQLEEATDYGRIDSLQPPYSLFWRQVEEDGLPYCLANDITILAYSSMAQGLLTGKFGPDHTFPKGDHRSKNKLFKLENYERVQLALERLRPIAARNGTSMGQLALAWLIAQPGTSAIAGARNAEQVRQNAKAGEISLTPTDLEEIDLIGRSVTDHLGDDSVMWEF